MMTMLEMGKMWEAVEFGIATLDSYLKTKVYFGAS
jgi:hypothetical protein